MAKRKVLIPLDGSENSRQILPHVQAWLKPDAHELILLRVSEPPQGLTRTPRESSHDAVVGSVLVQMVQAGMVFVKVNLYLQPIVLAGIIFLAVFFDSLREARLLKLKRRFIRVEPAKDAREGGAKT